LRAWLADTTATLPDIRDIGLLKLFFGALTEQDNLLALAHGQREAHQRRLALYKALSAQQPPGPAGAAVRLGLAYESAATTFWDSIAEHPPA